MRHRESLAGTIWQSGRQLTQLMRCMRPTWHEETVDTLAPASFVARGIVGVIWDVDGTLTPHHGETVPATIAGNFDAIVADPRLRHLVLSNAPEARFLQLGRMFPEMPILRVYELQGKLHRRVLLRGRDSMPADRVSGLQEAGARALRKPHATLIREALDVLLCAASEAVMIGDQYLTDVAGAGLADVRSIKVRTLAPESFPISVRAAQATEQLLFALRYGAKQPRFG